MTPVPPAANLGIMISLCELCVSFRGRTVLDRLTFDVEPGTVTGFLGPNGAGKSTTMNAIVGLVSPSSGAATVHGQVYRTIDQPLRRVGALLDDAAPHGDLTARRHLTWLATTHSIPRVRIDQVLELVGLTADADRRVRTFSLGMRRRLGLAAALLGDPGTVILDEPTNGLDPEGIRWIRTLLTDLAAEGRTVFVSSHLLNEMTLIADHLIMIDRGRLIGRHTTASLAERFPPARTRAWVSDPAAFASLLCARDYRAAVEPDGTVLVDGASLHELTSVAGGAIEIFNVSAERPPLEDIFLALVDESRKGR